jgi:excisionase family DNA binding protein
MSDAAVAPRPIAPAAAAEAVGWLRLGPASRLLGVDPDTLRRWADEGRVEAYVTPGGHRRFDRRTIERVVGARRTGVRPLASLGAGSDRMARAYRRRYASTASAEGTQEVDIAARDRYRRDGRRLVDALVAHLDADPADLRTRDAAELQARRVVDDLARRMAAGGTSLTEAVGLFVASRRPFLAELAGLGRRRALDSVRLAGLYEDASGLLDRLLVRFIDTYQEGAG